MGSVLGSLSTETLSVKRYAAGSWVEGRFVRGDESTTQILASVQPLSPNEIVKLPEHMRNRETLKIYTGDRLFLGDEKSGKSGDIITHDGREFEVQKVENWHIGTNLQHYKAYAVLIEGEGSRAD